LWVAQPEVRVDRVRAGLLQGVRADLLPQADAPALVAAHVDDHAAVARDQVERGLQLLTAVAAVRTECVPREALGVYADQGRFSRRRLMRGRLTRRRRRLEREVLDAGPAFGVQFAPRAGEEGALRGGEGDGCGADDLGRGGGVVLLDG